VSIPTPLLPAPSPTSTFLLRSIISPPMPFFPTAFYLPLGSYPRMFRINILPLCLSPLSPPNVLGPVLPFRTLCISSRPYKIYICGWGLGRGVPSWILCPPPSHSPQGAVLWRYNPLLSHWLACAVGVVNSLIGCRCRSCSSSGMTPSYWLGSFGFVRAPSCWLAFGVGVTNSLVGRRWCDSSELAVQCSREELQDSPLSVSRHHHSQDRLNTINESRKKRCRKRGLEASRFFL